MDVLHENSHAVMFFYYFSFVSGQAERIPFSLNLQKISKLLREEGQEHLMDMFLLELWTMGQDMSTHRIKSHISWHNS